MRRAMLRRRRSRRADLRVFTRPWVIETSCIELPWLLLMSCEVYIFHWTAFETNNSWVLGSLYKFANNSSQRVGSGLWLGRLSIEANAIRIGECPRK